MKYRKFNKYEKKENSRHKLENDMHGEGLYLYRNNTNADMTLPRPTKSGLRSVGPGKEFQGDNYYMQMVRVGHLRLVKELQAPVVEPSEEIMNEEQKLILDQPEIVTNQGQVEHVQSPVQTRPLNEGGNQAKPDILINESPVDDGFVIVGD